jgi:hypothetical protein
MDTRCVPLRGLTLSTVSLRGLRVSLPGTPLSVPCRYDDGSACLEHAMFEVRCFMLPQREQGTEPAWGASRCTHGH